VRPALPAVAIAVAAALLAAAPAAPAAVRVSPVGVRPHGTLTVHVTGRLPQTVSIDGRRLATARKATTRVSLRSRIAQGRHRLRACRGRSCSTSAPFVVTNGPIVGGCPVLPPDSPWNTDISSAPLAADSAALVGAQAAGHDVHLDFGDTQSEYGIPYALVGPGQRRVGAQDRQGRCAESEHDRQQHQLAKRPAHRMLQQQPEGPAECHGRQQIGGEPQILQQQIGGHRPARAEIVARRRGARRIE